jgi:hypothetical protein
LLLVVHCSPSAQQHVAIFAIFFLIFVYGHALVSLVRATNLLASLLCYSWQTCSSCRTLSL